MLWRPFLLVTSIFQMLLATLWLRADIFVFRDSAPPFPKSWLRHRVGMQYPLHLISYIFLRSVVFSSLNINYWAENCLSSIRRHSGIPGIPNLSIICKHRIRQLGITCWNYLILCLQDVDVAIFNHSGVRVASEEPCQQIPPPSANLSLTLLRG